MVLKQSASLKPDKIRLRSLPQTPTLKYELSHLPKTSIAWQRFPSSASLPSSRADCTSLPQAPTLEYKLSPSTKTSIAWKRFLSPGRICCNSLPHTPILE